MNRKNIPELCVLICILVVLGLSSKVWAQADLVTDSSKARHVQLVVGKSMVIKTDRALSRISEPDQGVASVILLSPHEVFVKGKGAGTTNLILWEKKRISAMYVIEVLHDVSQLKQKLHEILPNEPEIRVLSTHDSITLAGKVSSATALHQAVTLAESFAEKGKIHNLLQVGGVQQVMLEVRVAEMAKSTTKKLGVNFNWFNGEDFAYSFLSGLSSIDEDGVLTLSESVNTLFRFHDGSSTWTGIIDALKENGLAKVLAEPTLIALSGQTAEFLAGGEFPILVPQGDETISVEYKPFGVGLSFTPTVLDTGKISMKLAPSVSELDYSSGVQYSGFTVPGITTRRASTTIELGDGQSFAIAGLLSETTRDSAAKFPGLGDIPVLGTLFRSKEFLKNETELIIIATPHLVKPVNGEELPLPTDFYKEPNDLEFYLLGLMEGQEYPLKTVTGQELDGQFGHARVQPEPGDVQEVGRVQAQVQTEG